MKWYKSKYVDYAIYTFTYYIIYKITGFEITSIIVFGQIMGELRRLTGKK